MDAKTPTHPVERAPSFPSTLLSSPMVLSRKAMMNKAHPPFSLRRILSVLALFLVLGFISYICSFKLLDRDFWWHVKAGEIMLQTKAMISIEPFAYPREGQPFQARFEWLAQIILCLLYHAGGATAIILYRTVFVALTFVFLLGIDRKNLWLNGFIAIIAANAARPGFVERPQLFSYAIFAAFLLFAFWLIEKRDEKSLSSIRRRKQIFAAFIGLQVLWVNLHGAVCLLTYILMAALITEEVGCFWTGELSPSWKSALPQLREEIKPLLFWKNKRSDGSSQPAGFSLALFLKAQSPLSSFVLLTAVLGLAFFVSPDTYRAAMYVFRLMTDQSVALIGEWQPRSWPVYGKELGPIWAIVIGALLLGRKGRVFSCLMLAITGTLSRKAFRHEMIFVFTATAITFFQLKHSSFFQEKLDRLLLKKTVTVFWSVVLWAGLGYWTYEKHYSFAQKDHLFGYGVFDLAKGAYGFLEREGIQGRMFNTDGIGGYLAYRGYPKRKIFIDGRNWDHGFEFMARTYFSGRDPKIWKGLEDQYQFTAAVIDYEAIGDNKGPLPYCTHLSQNPNWKLVYLDDRVVVYLKTVLQNKSVIERCEYKALTPERLWFVNGLDSVPPEKRPFIERELERSVASNPDSVKARLALARVYIGSNRLDQAIPLLQEVQSRQPYQPESYALLAAVHSTKGEWLEAGDLFDKAIHLTGDAYPNINYSFVADVFDRAGRPSRARYYRHKAFLNSRENPARLPDKSQEPPSPTLEKPVSAPQLIEKKISETPSKRVTVKDIPESMRTLSQTGPTGELANKLAKELISGQQEDLRRWNDQGVEYALHGERDKAKQEFERALEVNPSYVEALNNLGSVYYQEKNYAQAIRYYRKALEKRPAYADAHFNLAMTFFHSGQYDEAEAQARLALVLGPRTRQLIADIKKARGDSR